MKSKIRLLLTVLALCVLVIAAAATWNYTALQGPLNTVIEGDLRNAGIVCRSHFGGYVRSEELVFDLLRVAPDKSPADVFRVLLQFAESVKDQDFSNVKLSFRGEVRFTLSGDYFQRLGREYSSQNPVYTMRTLPENLLRPDGSKAFPEWTGGLLGVMSKQMEDFGQFHREWYISEMKRQP